MKNKEKYAKEILEISCDGCTISVSKSTGKPEKCDFASCNKCLFSIDGGLCAANEKIREWAESEPWLIEDLKNLEVVEEYEKIEKHNMDTFQANGMRHGSELMYRCTVCGNLTNLDGSFSQNGHHLICTGCVKKNGGLPTMMKWVYQEQKGSDCYAERKGCISGRLRDRTGRGKSNCRFVQAFRRISAEYPGRKCAECMPGYSGSACGESYDGDRV